MSLACPGGGAGGIRIENDSQCCSGVKSVEEECNDDDGSKKKTVVI